MVCFTIQQHTCLEFKVRFRQSLSGYLSWCTGVVRLGHIYLRHLWDYMASFPQWATSSFQLKIPHNVRLDLTWWNSLLPHFNGILLFNEDCQSISLYSDACNKGLGAYFSYSGEPLLQRNSFSMKVAKDHLG
jgi:hypothetical protein